MKKKLGLFLCLIFISLTTAHTTVMAEELPAFAKVAVDGVRLRMEPHTDARILAVMNIDAVLTVLGFEGDWYKVMYDNQLGYVFGEFISLPGDWTPDAVEEPFVPEVYFEPGVVNDHGVRLRAAGSTDSEILATMDKGTAVTVTGSDGEWRRVMLGDRPGYIYGVYVTLSETLESVDEVGYINVDGVRLRAENNTDSEILTVMAVRTPLTVLDKVDDWYKVDSGNKTGYVLGTYVTLGEESRAAALSANISAAPNSIVFNPDGKSELIDWSDAKQIMTSGTRAIVTDVATGISFEIRVLANGNHADVEPLTASDTASILQIRGSYSWTPRAVYVTVDGRTMAASCNGMPHEQSTIKDNNFPGHFCIHFYNSRNHYNNAVDPGHQGQVAIAHGE